MPETWQCGYCKLQVAIPDRETNKDGYIDTLALIGEHRFGHLVDALIEDTTEAVFGLPMDRPPAVTNDDVAPALAEVDRILRRT